MKNLRRIVVLGAALMMPAGLEAQPRKGTDGRWRADVAIGYRGAHAAPWGYRGCGPRRHADVRCRNPRVVVRPGARRGWVVAHWDGTFLRVPRTRSASVRLGERGLRDVLGHETVDRIRHLARRHGLRGPMRGVWTRGRGFGSTLEIRIHRHPVAELRDFNGDGYVDRVFVPRHLIW